jgi:hypothetical protein
MYSRHVRPAEKNSPSLNKLSSYALEKAPFTYDFYTFSG